MDNLLPADCANGNYSIANRNCSGSDGNGYNTFQEVPVLTQPGDLVLVRSGIYSKPVTSSTQPEFRITVSGTQEAPIAYKNYNQESVIFEGEHLRQGGQPNPTTSCNDGKRWKTVLEVNANYINLEGFEIQGGCLTGLKIADSENVNVTKIKAHDTWGSANSSWLSGIWALRAKKISIDHVVSYGNGPPAGIDSSIVGKSGVGVLLGGGASNRTDYPMSGDSVCLECTVQYSLLYRNKQNTIPTVVSADGFTAVQADRLLFQYNVGWQNDDNAFDFNGVVAGTFSWNVAMLSGLMGVKAGQGYGGGALIEIGNIVFYNGHNGMSPVRGDGNVFLNNIAYRNGKVGFELPYVDQRLVVFLNNVSYRNREGAAYNADLYLSQQCDPSSGEECVLLSDHNLIGLQQDLTNVRNAYGTNFSSFSADPLFENPDFMGLDVNQNGSVEKGEIFTLGSDGEPVGDWETNMVPAINALDHNHNGTVEPSELFSDVNGDGEITAEDALAIIHEKFKPRSNSPLIDAGERYSDISAFMRTDASLDKLLIGVDQLRIQHYDRPQTTANYNRLEEYLLSWKENRDPVPECLNCLPGFKDYYTTFDERDAMGNGVLDGNNDGIFEKDIGPIEFQSNAPSGCASQPDGTPCNDDFYCTENDACQSGACVGTARSCVQDQCNSGICNENLDRCETVADGTSCNDDNLCTSGEMCIFGICTGGSSVDCSDPVLCTTDSCDPETGCVHSPNDEFCPPGQNCDPSNASHDPAMGCVCHPTEPGVESTCSDGLDNDCDGFIDLNDSDCASPECNQDSDCNDDNGCTDDSCVSGDCIHTNNSGTCNDGNACTQVDICQSGTCVGTNSVLCKAQDQCHEVGACDPNSGECSNPEKPDFASCDDHDACTNIDTCLSGVCKSGSPANCDDQNPCTADSCHPVEGCIHDPVSDGTLCTDDDVCNGEEICKSGFCMPGDPLNCMDHNQCNGTETCDSQLGCQAGTPINCDDGISCTLDSCDESAQGPQCKNAPTDGCDLQGSDGVAEDEDENQFCILGDTNDDGQVNSNDEPSFADALNGIGSKQQFCAADVNQDGVANGFDIEPFKNLISNSSQDSPNFLGAPNAGGGLVVLGRKLESIQPALDQAQMTLSERLTLTEVAPSNPQMFVLPPASQIQEENNVEASALILIHGAENPNKPPKFITEPALEAKLPVDSRVRAQHEEKILEKNTGQTSNSKTGENFEWLEQIKSWIGQIFKSLKGSQRHEK